MQVLCLRYRKQRELIGINFFTKIYRHSSIEGVKMYVEILYRLVPVLILFGLAKFTDNVLELRQRQREKGKNIKTNL